MKTRIMKLLAVAAAPWLWACNDIDGADRLIELPAVESERVVLLEEFTGQKCVNCPEAHKTVEQLIGQYPDNLVAVSLHGGGDALSYSETQYSYGLRTEESQAYCDAAGAYALPAGVVDRNSGAKTPDQWAALIRQELAKPAYMDLSLSASVGADGEIDVKVDVEPHKNYSAHVQVWIVEDGIIARQLTPEGTDHKYVHNHVFRAAVNGADGEAAKLAVREPWSREYTIKMKEKWNAANLSVVAFVYDIEGMLQAACVKVENK